MPVDPVGNWVQCEKWAVRRGPGEWSWGIGGAPRNFSTGRAGEEPGSGSHIEGSKARRALRGQWELEGNVC